LYAVSLAPIILFVIIFLTDRRKTFAFLRSLRITRIIHYSVIFSLGFLMSVIQTDRRGYFRTYDQFLYFFSGLVLINLLFCSSMMLNNIFDCDIDLVNSKLNAINTGQAGRGGHYLIFAVCSLFSLAISMLSSMTVFYVSSAILFIAYIYSCPPLRLKKIFPLNILLISFSTVIAMFLGYCYSSSGTFGSFNCRLGIVCFTVLALAFNVKDINDLEGDKKYGVTTIMTLAGSKNGRLIISFLAFSGYILLPVLMTMKIMILPAMAAGVVTVILINTKQPKINEGLIMAVFFIFAGVFAVAGAGL
jgi:4-hydroxybenzoate polyprenyltransferase